MEVVLDTNVIVSSLINPAGSPGRILASNGRGLFEWVSSGDLLAELESTLSRERILRRLAWTVRDVAVFMDGARDQVKLVISSTSLSVISHDPADDRVLEAAIAGEVDYIVSGDRHLRDLGEFEGIPILAPAVFMSILDSVT